MKKNQFRMFISENIVDQNLFIICLIFPKMAEENLVHLRCVKEGGKLRVRITSPGYNSAANCQFPRNIRKEGCSYTVPVSSVKFAELKGKFFYRINGKHVTQIQEKVTFEKIYENDETECIVCMENEHDVILFKCGHYCLCNVCATKIKESSGKCPMCRADIDIIVTLDQIQT